MTGHVYLKDVLPEACGLEIEPHVTLDKVLLSPQQESALMQLIRVSDPEMKQQLIMHNLSLIVSIARRYSNHGIALFELIGEGIQGLIHALESFELEGGFRFAAYAGQCVRQSIERAIVSRNDRLCTAVFQNMPSMICDVRL